MEVIGDPLSLFDNLGTGFADFFRKTKSEMIGDSKTRGDGLKRLARTLVGSTFGSAAKISGTLAELVGNVVGIEGVEDYRGALMASDNTRLLKKEKVGNTISTGFRAGGEVFVQSIVHGFSGLVEYPTIGYDRNGVRGAVMGSLKGVVGLIAGPVTGALGAVSVVAESVQLSATFNNGRPVGRRRKRRMGGDLSESVTCMADSPRLPILDSICWNDKESDLNSSNNSSQVGSSRNNPMDMFLIT
jgi:vacuolar protein sorting-associated protein 13A/C